MTWVSRDGGRRERERERERERGRKKEEEEQERIKNKERKKGKHREMRVTDHRESEEIFYGCVKGTNKLKFKP
jgi:hypothetical protein